MEDNLREALKQNMAWYGHSQTDLSRLSGVTYSHVSNIVRGERGGSLAVWERLLNVYGLGLAVKAVK